MSERSEERSFDRDSIRFFWRASLQNRRRLLLRMLLYPTASVLLGTVAPFFVGKILASLGQPNNQAFSYLGWFAAAGVAGFLFNMLGFTAFMTFQARTQRYLQRQSFDYLLKRSAGFHNNNIGGKLVSDALDFPLGFSQVANAFFAQIVPFALVLIVGSIIITLHSWVLGVLIVIMTIVSVGGGYIESRRRSNLRKYRLIASKAVTAHVADTIVNVQTVKTFAHEAREMKTHDKLANHLMLMRLRDWHKATVNGSFRILLLVVMQAIFIAILIVMVRNDPSLLAIGIFAFTYTLSLSSKLFDIYVMIRTVEDGLLAAEPMTEILLQNVEIPDVPDAQPLKVTKGTLELSDVVFKYDDDVSNKEVFTNLSLSVKSGEKVGLVGPSGGGKSTLTRLLLRFEDIQSGSITIDGQNIALVTQGSLREQISYVPQEPLLFHRSVAENISYGALDAKVSAVTHAAHLANADDFISELPKQYETIVGERGVKLSGGQRQRVAIARAILKNAPILILDEATSALDSENEKLIQGALWNLMKDKTAVVIAHRLSTVQRMDRIIVLDNGQIKEEGTHEQLLKAGGLYAKLWAHQSGGFLEE